MMERCGFRGWTNGFGMINDRVVHAMQLDWNSNVVKLVVLMTRAHMGFRHRRNPLKSYDLYTPPLVTAHPTHPETSPPASPPSSPQ